MAQVNDVVVGLAETTKAKWVVARQIARSPTKMLIQLFRKKARILTPWQQCVAPATVAIGAGMGGAEAARGDEENNWSNMANIDDLSLLALHVDDGLQQSELHDNEATTTPPPIQASKFAHQQQQVNHIPLYPNHQMSSIYLVY